MTPNCDVYNVNTSVPCDFNNINNVILAVVNFDLFKWKLLLGKSYNYGDNLDIKYGNKRHLCGCIRSGHPKKNDCFFCVCPWKSIIIRIDFFYEYYNIWFFM